MNFEQWKEALAPELERQFGWDKGEGAAYIASTGDDCWHDAFKDGLSPADCAAEEVYAANS